MVPAIINLNNDGKVLKRNFHQVESSLTQEFLTILEQQLIKQTQLQGQSQRASESQSKHTWVWKCSVPVFIVNTVKKQAIDLEGKRKVDAMDMKTQTKT